jgi:hypothetical protein
MQIILTTERTFYLKSLLTTYSLPSENNEIYKYAALLLQEGAAAAGNMWISLYQTVRKNGVSFLLYLQDRLNDLNQIAQLSVIIELRA